MNIDNAEFSIVSPDAFIRADAIDIGDGGRVIVWADNTTYFYGAMSARGSPNGGDGGFAEISGKNDLVYRGEVDVGAELGAPGQVLFDPKNITVANGGSSAITTNSFTESPSSSVTFDADQITTIINGGNNLTLQANNDITIS